MRQIRVRIVRTKRDGVVLKWRDPVDGPRQIRAEGTTQRKWEDHRRRLEMDLNNVSGDLKWSEFWDRICEDYLDALTRKHWNKCHAMYKRLQAAADSRRLSPFYCKNLSIGLIKSVETSMIAEGLAAASVRSNMNSLWSILTWGMDEELLPRINRPRKRRSKRSKQESQSKGRSLTLEEIERIEMMLDRARKPFEPKEPFIRAMTAARLIGLRLSDCWAFRWDPQPGCHYPLNLHGKHPMIEFSFEQKSGNNERVPLTPQAIVWLRSIEQVEGWICRTHGARGEHKTPNRLGRVISDAGRLANVVVKKNGGKGGKPKYASAHDLRRTFATTWHQKLTVSELQKLTRHADPQTLLTYYADAPTEFLATKLSQYADSILAESGGEGGGDVDG